MCKWRDVLLRRLAVGMACLLFGGAWPLVLHAAARDDGMPERAAGTFVQRKTQVANVLPMPEEVWLAVADYIRDERPDVGDDRVFVTARAPYHAVDSPHTFHRMVARALADAGVETAGKHRGMHSLRHSAATNMLSGGTPYPTISSVLGHSSVNVTKRYLSIDVESLRPLALEVPTCR